MADLQVLLVRIQLLNVKIINEFSHQLCNWIYVGKFQFCQLARNINIIEINKKTSELHRRIWNE